MEILMNDSWFSERVEKDPNNIENVSYPTAWSAERQSRRLG